MAAILVLAQPDDDVANALEAADARSGRQVVRPRPEPVVAECISWSTLAGSDRAQAVISLPAVADQPVASVLLRALRVEARPGSDLADAAYLATEWQQALLTLLAQHHGPVVNRPSLVRPQSAVYHPPSLFSAARHSGLQLADAALASDAEAVTRFAAEHPAGILVRDLGTGAVRTGPPAAPELGVPLLLTERFAARALRVFIVGSEVIAERSLRVWQLTDDEETRRNDSFEPWRPKPAFAARCRQLAARLGLTFAALVFAHTVDGPVLSAATAHPELASAAPQTAHAVTAALLDVLTVDPQ